MSIVALFASHCDSCDGPIRVGEQITRASYVSPWTHAVCPPSKFDFTPDQVCGECFTVKTVSGACACPA